MGNQDREFRQLKILSLDGSEIYKKMHPLSGEAMLKVKKDNDKIDANKLKGYLDESLDTVYLERIYSKYKENFTLLYLWYDVPNTKEAKEHQEEIEAFATIAKADGINFHHITYQKVINKLNELCPEECHQDYRNYLNQRYNQRYNQQ